MLRLYALAVILGTSDAFAPRPLKSGAAKRTNAARCTTIMSGLIGFATMSGSDPVQIERFTLQARGSIAPCHLCRRSERIFHLTSRTRPPAGNTERIAGYIGDATGISPTPIADVSAADLEAADCIICGAPTWNTGADDMRSGG